MEINGKPVEDATHHMFIEISDEDCSKGKRKGPKSCASARAIVRDYEVLSARVHVGVTYVEENNRWIRYLTPRSLGTEIKIFDRGSSFSPGNYMLSPPGPAQRLEATRKRRQRTDNRAGRHDINKSKRRRHDTTNVRERSFYR